MACGKYCSRQFSKEKWFLTHDDVADFYISCWQTNRATLPLFCLRLVLFLVCVGILLASMIMTGAELNLGFWFIFMTHWGVVMMTVTTGFAAFVSFKAYSRGHIDHFFELPWYVKTYWALNNITVTMAFFITVFYWSLLTGLDIEYAINPVLDVLIHAINSVVMFILLATSRHPTQILHFFHPLLFGIIYLIFSVIYYFAGGVDPFGNRYLYPMLDWSQPGMTAIMVVLTAVGITIVYFLVVLLSELRDFATKRYIRDSKSINIS